MVIFFSPNLLKKGMAKATGSWEASVIKKCLIMSYYSKYSRVIMCLYVLIFFIFYNLDEFIHLIGDNYLVAITMLIIRYYLVVINFFHIFTFYIL